MVAAAVPPAVSSQPRAPDLDPLDDHPGDARGEVRSGLFADDAQMEEDRPGQGVQHEVDRQDPAGLTVPATPAHLPQRR
ncbi:hypothetical protein, partial [Streptomyces sp. CC77]|uniref:hypothetical protein n=1 Tax=Streptomyces sp. CC77 TaxID=1906739 RepID=UPI001C31C135